MFVCAIIHIFCLMDSIYIIQKRKKEVWLRAQSTYTMYERKLARVARSHFFIACYPYTTTRYNFKPINDNLIFWWLAIFLQCMLAYNKENCHHKIHGLKLNRLPFALLCTKTKLHTLSLPLSLYLLPNWTFMEVLERRSSVNKQHTTG